MRTQYAFKFILGLLYVPFACSVAWLNPTLCDPMDCSSPGSSVHGIFQARILKWLPFSPPRDHLEPGIEPKSPALAGGFFTTESPGKHPYVPFRI